MVFLGYMLSEWDFFEIGRKDEKGEFIKVKVDKRSLLFKAGFKDPISSLSPT